MKGIEGFLFELLLNFLLFKRKTLSQNDFQRLIPFQGPEEIPHYPTNASETFLISTQSCLGLSYLLSAKYS
jgi:hypothetical protein